jgi:hypothetical protein
MAALNAHLAGTRILFPEKHRPATPERERISVTFDSLALQAFYDITEVHQTHPESLKRAGVEEDYSAQPLTWSLSATEITSLPTPSRTRSLPSSVTAQLQFLSDQQFSIPNRYASIETSAVAPLAQRILRTHFLTDILAQLSNLATFARSEQAPNYAGRLFRAMRLFRDHLPTDPFSAVVLALYDALAFDNNWIRYTAQQYAKAREILRRFGNQDLNENKALKAVAALEDIGFDTTPFSIPDDDPVDA